MINIRVDIISLFPEMFTPLEVSIIGRAIEKGILSVNHTNFRDYATDKHHHVDDAPFGGGAGMVLRPEPLITAIKSVCHQTKEYEKNRIVLLMDPSGETFSQNKAKELAKYSQLIFVCGHYEGFDARVANYTDEAISIGDYVLTGGELPAMVIIDAVARMLPGVLGAADSAQTDSFYDNLLGYPQYTRPRVFDGMEVPEVLISGDHAKIARWRYEEAIKKTKKYRPDLLRDC